jgi:transcriptional regulator with XRE-family HTH domain
MASLQKKLGLTIKKLRGDNDLSQEALASKVELHRTYIGVVERGKATISLANLEKIADVFGIAVSELIARAERE